MASRGLMSEDLVSEDLVSEDLGSEDLGSPGVVVAADALRAALAGFEPARWSGRDCATVVEALAVTEKACAAARARAAARAAACGAHRDRGFSDAGQWLARHAGSSVAEGRAALATAKAIEACPDAQAAMVSGALSLAQAAEIAKTEAACPGSQAELVALAQGSSLAALSDQARTRRLGALDPEELHRRQHQARSLRHWRDGLGMVCLSGALAPEVGLAIVNRLDAEAERLRRQARRDGRDESRSAHAADALVAALAGTGPGRARRAELVIVCDLAAYRRGHRHDGEVCHLIGGGPIPVRLARQFCADAFVKAVLHEGVRIDTVAHFGRHINAELRTALELGAPPEFEGARCAEAGCGRRYGLEWDHVDPKAHGGATSYANLQARCWPHHQDKTDQDRQAGLLGNGRSRGQPP